MRRNLLLLFALAFAFAMNTEVKGAQPQKNNYQEIIADALKTAMATKSVAPLEKVENELKQKKANRVYNYWIGCCQLYKAFYHNAMQQGKEAQACLNEGEQILDAQTSKNSEDYALLAYLQTISIKYATGMEAAIRARKSTNSAQQASQIDPQNPRARYVLGTLDYFTPKQFGGKQRCEALLEKALAQPVPKVANPYAPTWGRKEAYNLLLDYLIETGNLQKAKTIYQKAIAEYPNATEFKKYENKL